MTSDQSLSENPSGLFSEEGHLTLNDHRARSPAVDVVFSPFVSITCVCLCQIAPAENPDVTERMVIITGTPEAQFKVKNKMNMQIVNYLEYKSASLNECFNCILVKKAVNHCLSLLFPSLSLPHSLLFLPGPRSDIRKAEGGELLHRKGGGETRDTHQGSFNCSWQGYWQRWQNGEEMSTLSRIMVKLKTRKVYGKLLLKILFHINKKIWEIQLHKMYTQYKRAAASIT